MTGSRNSINSVQRRLQVEEALTRYPHLTTEQLNDLISWFKCEATALEVATLASDPGLYPQYREFRSKHLENFTDGEMVICIGFVAVLIVTLAVIVAMP